MIKFIIVCFIRIVVLDGKTEPEKETRVIYVGALSETVEGTGTNYGQYLFLNKYKLNQFMPKPHCYSSFYGH